jgi:VCBS repeat-containing protein
MAQIILDSSNNLIQGDFDNATINNRTKFKTTTTNATTNVYAVPNGSATSAGFTATNAADPTNASKITIATNGSTDTQIISGVNGSGTYLPLSFYTNNTLAMQIDNSQNVGIGTASPANSLQISKATYPTLQLTETTVNNSLYVQYHSGAAVSYITNTGAYPIVFKTTDTERMRITSTGTVLFGTTSAPSSGLFRAYGNASADFSFGPQTGVGTNAFVVYNAGTSTGVYLVAGNTSWTSSSDERVKDIIEPITNAAEKVSTLRTVIGKYKTDEDGVRRPFLIAQDIQAVLPEAVDASKPDDLGVQYTDVIPLLTAAIKELKTELDAVKAELATLKGA